MNTNKEEMRELAALFYSVVLSTMSGDELRASLEQLIKMTKDNHVTTFLCLLLLVFSYVLYVFTMWLIGNLNLTMARMY